MTGCTYQLPISAPARTTSCRCILGGAAFGMTIMVPMHILLAEDERDLGEWLCRALQQSGHRVDWRDDGRWVEQALAEADYDALVLDLGLPGRSGTQILGRLRERDVRLPVLVLTARDSLSDRVDTLNLGADDFLCKPFALAELEARLTALVRRARGSEHPRLACGPLVLDTVTRQFTLSGELFSLSPREHALLRALITRSGEPLSRQHVLDRVFHDDEDVQPSVVDVLLHRLRKRLEHSSVRIHTYRGLGYALESDASVQS